MYIVTVCQLETTSTPRLPPIQELYVSTAKSTQPVQVDTSHIGISDSGATDHFFCEKTYFLTYTPVHGKFIMMANGASIPVLGMGTASLTINGIPVKQIEQAYTGEHTAVPSSEITMGCTSPLAESSPVCNMRLTIESNSVRCNTT
jgi:hypothetical protein